MTALEALVPVERVKLVRRELADARRRALSLLPVPVQTITRGDGGRGTVVRQAKGCVGCGVHRDKQTPGCWNCRMRHYMRGRQSRRSGG